MNYSSSQRNVTTKNAVTLLPIWNFMMKMVIVKFMT